MTQAERIGTEPIQKPGRSKQDYGTPRAFIDACEVRFGVLRFDLACTTENCKAPAGYYFDEGVDALKQEWAKDWPEGNLWLNPPFGDIDPWAEKCAYESERRHGLILMLTPASVGTNWFSKHVLGKAMVLGLSPRMAFEGTTAPYPKDLMISCYGFQFHGFDQWRWDA